MSYTPPIGNAIWFRLEASGYVPPAGDSVAFGPTSMVDVSVVLAVDALGVHGVTGGVQYNFVPYAEVDGFVPICARVMAELPLSVEVAGTFPIIGSVDCELPLATLVTVTAAAIGVIDTTVNIEVAASGGGVPIVGDVLYDITFEYEAFGLHHPPVRGSVDCSMRMAVDATGFMAAFGPVDVAFKLSANAVGYCGVAGTVDAALPMRVEAVAARGAVGHCDSALLVTSDARGAVGCGAVCDALVSLDTVAFGAVGVRAATDVLLPLSLSALGAALAVPTPHIPHSDTLYVLTRTLESPAYVR